MDYKVRANNRRDFRHTRNGPEVFRYKPKVRGKKPWKLMCLNDCFLDKGPWVYSRYRTKAQAEQALKAKQTDPFLKFKIEGPDDE